jgi:23S rRNA (uracil1939-C5)-methyltransferase
MDASNELILEITDLSRSGAGVSRSADGRVVFVPFTAPGDQVRVRIISEEKRYAQGELLEILKPSPGRQTPPCPVFGKCGGCQWQHIPYKIQWETKSKGVLHALKRVQVSFPNGALDLLPAEQIWNYRNRVQLRGFQDELGFYAARSHERVAIEGCSVARPELNAMLPSVLQEGRRFEVPYKVEIEILPDGSTRSQWNSAHAAAGFRQVHDEQNEKLRSWVAAQITPGVHVFDLYGGSGNLASAVAPRVPSVDCVDIGAPEGTRVQNFPQIRFHRSPVSKWLIQQSRRERTISGEFCSAIIDPPREGLGDEQTKIARCLEDLKVHELVAVGCDVDSWARDVSRFVKRGWRVERVAVLDLFPQTPHVESLALLRR